MNAPRSTAPPEGVQLTDPGWRSWYTVGVLTLLYTLAMLDRSILSLLVVPIKHDFGVTDVQLSLLLGLSFAIFYSLLTIPAGYLVDRISRRALVGTSVLLWSAMTVSAGAARSFGQLFVARMGVGVGEAGISPAAFSLIRNSLPARQHGRAFSIYALGPVLGNAGAFMLGGLLLAAAGRGTFDHLPLLASLRPWQIVLVIVGLIGLPLSLLAATLQEPARANAAQRGGTFADAFRHIYENRARYGCILGFAISINMVAAAYSAWTPTIFARTFALEPTAIAFRIGAINLACAPIGLLLVGISIDRLASRGTRDAAARVGLLTTTAVLVVGTMLPLASSIPAAFVLLAMLQLVLASFYTVAATLLTAATPVHLIGKVTALYLAFTGVLAQSFGPLAAAYLGQHLFTGRTALGWGVSVTVLVFATTGIMALALLVFGKAERQVLAS
jgi:MFS family permease